VGKLRHMPPLHLMRSNSNKANLLLACWSKTATTSLIINPAGGILLKHRQVHNGPPYACEQGFQAIDTRFGCIGLAVCGDVFESDIIQQ